ncbi:restriction endonuclease subunit S [Corynebacterium imitans]|uniref:restriction endonuclease subunit S n=1 Tax=Corynebacterium imitans TaxID=156978 RepID=UPI00255009D5|nr:MULTISPECIES: restriction endonuclease subunit S [Bacteria]MDK8314304.1 restriction endonuclease subunit S [Klebsiella aerogenes]MDK8638602.1 restriction endonuclease subunit S [Corynebacterium imitans]MDK8773811.1 restriction endonuclease subunit S [Corynebacterium imitans]
MTATSPLEDWKKIPTRYLFRFTRGYAIGRAEMGSSGIPCVHYGDIHTDYGFEVDLDTARLGRVAEPGNHGVNDFVSKGQFLFAGSSEDYEGSGNFTLIQGAQRGIAGTDTIVLTPRGKLPDRFIAYLFDSLFFREQIRPHMMGTKVFHPSQRVIKDALCILPPRHVADTVALYLDGKTAEIDTLIEKLTRQMELLERYRRELIARTVTRGLDPDAPMRDSGIEWIGEIPSAWSEDSLKSILRRVSIKNKPERRVLSVERVNGVVDRETEGSPDNHNRLSDDLSGYLAVDRGQFAMNKMKAWRGSYGVSKLDGIVSPAYYVFDLNHPNPEFFNWAIRSDAYVPFFSRDSYGIRTGQWDFKMSALRSIPFFSPTIDEQDEIVAYLERETEVIDSSIEGIMGLPANGGHVVELPHS